MSYGINKKDNEYARVLRDVDAPKTVWMAIALSFAMRIVESNDPIATTNAVILIKNEWQALHDNGIVPQKPRP